MLTDRQTRFVAEYLIDLNSSAAARRAGYSEKTADAQGSRLLTNVEIRAAIQQAIQRRSERTEITADKVLREYARIAFSDLREVLTWGPAGIALRDSCDLDDDTAAAVAEISETITKDGGTVRAKLHSKMDALDKLSRHLGLFDDDRSPAADPVQAGKQIKASLRAMFQVSGGTGNGDTPAPFWMRGGSNGVQQDEGE